MIKRTSDEIGLTDINRKVDAMVDRNYRLTEVSFAHQGDAMRVKKNPPFRLPTINIAKSRPTTPIVPANQ
jgi:hypothetical protein